MNAEREGSLLRHPSEPGSTEIDNFLSLVHIVHPIQVPNQHQGGLSAGKNLVRFSNLSANIMLSKDFSVYFNDQTKEVLDLAHCVDNQCVINCMDGGLLAS